jgi:hypothetical protein
MSGGGELGRPIPVNPGGRTPTIVTGTLLTTTDVPIACGLPANRDRQN